MSVRTQRRAVRLFGIAAGLAALTAVIVANRPEIQPPKLGAAISVQVASGGAIELLTPGDGFALAAASMRPGDAPLRGTVIMRNRSRVPFRVALRPEPPPEARRAPQWEVVQLEAGRRGEFASGTVAKQRSGPQIFASPTRGVVIPGGGRISIPLRLSLRATAPGEEALAGERLRLVLVPVRKRI